MHIVPVVVCSHSIVMLLLSRSGGLSLSMLMGSRVVLLWVMALGLMEP